jgi:hypothetical protein
VISWIGIEHVSVSDHGGIPVEPGAPQTVADHDDPISIVGGRQPPDLRPYAERGENVIGGERHPHTFDATVRTQRRGPHTEPEDAVEQLRALFVLETKLRARSEPRRQV